MKKIIHDSQEIVYSVERTKRSRTLAIVVSASADVIVRVPYSAGLHLVEDFVREKADWILTKQKKFKKHISLHPKKQFKNGEKFYFLGEEAYLAISKGQKIRTKVSLNNEHIEIVLNENIEDDKVEEEISKALQKWYFKQAKDVISDRVERYSKVMDLYPSKVIIKNQKKRWGSCSFDGIVRFNWRIVIAPLDVLDYIVVHELGHLKVRDHSKKFYSLVEQVLPDYRLRRKWLKDNSLMLKI